MYIYITIYTPHTYKYSLYIISMQTRFHTNICLHTIRTCAFGLFALNFTNYFGALLFSRLNFSFAHKKREIKFFYASCASLLLFFFTLTELDSTNKNKKMLSLG